MKLTSDNRILEDREPADTEALHLAEAYMYKDKPLTPRMISSLMRVDSSLPHIYDNDKRERANTLYSFLYMVGIGIFALIVAGGVGTLLLYVHEIGPFSDRMAGVHTPR